jgi:hypothetical protein
MPEDDEPVYDDDAKAHPEAFQEDFLRECAAAVEAGFTPSDGPEPEYETDDAAVAAAWAEAGQ